MKPKKKPLALPKMPTILSDNVTKVLLGLMQHPAIACLGVMVGSTVVSTVATLADPDVSSQRTQEVRGQMTGIYNGAQALALASVVVPIVPSIISSIGGAVTGSLGAVYKPAGAA